MTLRWRVPNAIVEDRMFRALRLFDVQGKEKVIQPHIAQNFMDANTFCIIQPYHVA